MVERILNIISIFIAALVVAFIVFLFFFKEAQAGELEDCKEFGDLSAMVIQSRVLGVEEDYLLNTFKEDEEMRAIIEIIYDLYIPESVFHFNTEGKKEFIKGFKKGWDQGCEEEYKGSYTKLGWDAHLEKASSNIPHPNLLSLDTPYTRIGGDVYYTEDGDPVWLEDTYGGKIKDGDEYLVDIPYVDSYPNVDRYSSPDSDSEDLETYLEF